MLEDEITKKKKTQKTTKVNKKKLMTQEEDQENLIKRTLKQIIQHNSQLI
jgi:hypothetical protein